MLCIKNTNNAPKHEILFENSDKRQEQDKHKVRTMVPIMATASASMCYQKKINQRIIGRMKVLDLTSRGRI